MAVLEGSLEVVAIDLRMASRSIWVKLGVNGRKNGINKDPEDTELIQEMGSYFSPRAWGTLVVRSVRGRSTSTSGQRQPFKALSRREAGPRVSWLGCST